MPALHRGRGCRCRQVPARVRVPRLGRGPSRPRPLPLLRRGHHLLAGGRGGEAAGRASLRPGRSSLAPLPAGARRTKEQAPRRSPGPSASCSRSARPLVCVFDDIQWGGGDVPRPGRARRRLSSRRADPAAVHGPARAAATDDPAGVAGAERDHRRSSRSQARTPSTRCSRRESTSGCARGSRTRPSGNPLFIERCWRMVRESEQRESRVPPTIQALLAARLDQLEPAERTRARARCGRRWGVPSRRRAGAGSGRRRQVSPRLVALVRKELIRPDQPAAPRRGRLPLPPPADPRRRLRRAAEGDPSRTARALRRLAGGARTPTWSSWTRSSATTSSRRARYKQELGSRDPELG